MQLFDTHAHINLEEFQGREDQVIQRAREDFDVYYMAVVGMEFDTIDQSLALSHAYPKQVISLIGWHPTNAGSFDQAAEDYLLERLQDPVVHGLGEIGLDYHWMRDSKEVQEEVFRRQIQIAKEVDLPIIIHNRDATEDTYQILKSEGLPRRGGIMHSFGESVADAERFLDLGMHLGFSGVLTFKNAPEVREIAQMVPDDRLLIETDTPYLTPEPYRGKRNEPGYVRFVAERLAQVRQQSLEEIAALTTANAMELFDWKPGL